MDLREQRKPRWTARRIMTPIIILVAAGAIGLIASYQSRQQMETVEAHVRELCSRAANDQELAGHVLVNDGASEAATIAAIREACSGVMADLSNLEVHVAPGDLGNVSQHRGTWTSATHRASIVVDGEATLDLRIRISKATMNRVVILGYWLPDSLTADL